MYLQPPLSLKQRLCNRTSARAFDDYQDYKSGGAQTVRGVHNQHATFDDPRFHSENDAMLWDKMLWQKQNMCLLAHTQT